MNLIWFFQYGVQGETAQVEAKSTESATPEVQDTETAKEGNETVEKEVIL